MHKRKLQTARKEKPKNYLNELEWKKFYQCCWHISLIFAMSKKNIRATKLRKILFSFVKFPLSFHPLNTQISNILHVQRTKYFSIHHSHPLCIKNVLLSPISFFRFFPSVGLTLHWKREKEKKQNFYNNKITLTF